MSVSIIIFSVRSMPSGSAVLVLTAEIGGVAVAEVGPYAVLTVALVGA